MSNVTSNMQITYRSIRSGKDDHDSEIVGEDGCEPVEEADCGESPEEDKPEVEEDVNLLVDDVQRQNTEGIVSLN